MSLSRENICWQSKDGKWTLAFWGFEQNPTEGEEDHDHEWDVTYNDSFNWVSGPHPTREAAQKSWTGANPGGGNELEYSEASAKECDDLDAKAHTFGVEEKQRQQARAKLFGGRYR